MFQKLHQIINGYYEKISSSIDMIDHCGASISTHSSLSKYILSKKEIISPSPSDIVDAREESNECDCVLAFLSGLNRKRYQCFLNELANSF